MELEVSGSIIRNRCYLVDCPLPGGPECETRSFVPVTDINQLSLWQLKRTICGMMNFGKSSVIFIGVLNNGSVKGVKLNRAQVSGAIFLSGVCE